MKIRIFALAKELDIDSKVLIDHCVKAGIAVKNVLASITPEERDTLVGYLASQRGGGSAPAAQEQSAPIARETPIEVAGKARPIRNMGMPARPTPGRTVRNEPEPAAPVDEPPTPDEEELPAETAAAPEPVAPATPEPEVEAPESPVTPATVAEVSPSETPPGTEPAAPETPPPADPGRKSPTRPAPMTRADYVAPGAGQGRQIRRMSMEPRGTSDTSGTRQIQNLKRPKGPSMPQIAAIPEFKSPVVKPVKPEEQKAQKPDISFRSADAAKAQSPLAGHLRKSAEIKKKLSDDEGEANRKGGKGAGAGAGLEESRLQRRDKQRRITPAEEEEAERQRTRFTKRRPPQRGKSELKTSAEIEPPITVRTLSESLGRPAKAILGILFARGEMVTINTTLTEDEAIEISMELGVDLQIKKEKDLEDELKDIFEEADPPETLVPRAPIVTILGHVDHGKTTLVDKIRSANVAASEHGGITQHIAAYQVEHNGQRITFVDTPGHAAFGEMRARGANVTDVIVLVVAANDGVMPQTVECIAHARAAGVPLIVAMNKVDLPDRNEQRVLQDLAAHNVLASEWGGEVEVVRTSGLTGIGVPELLDTILLTAELHEYQANPSRPACGVCLEAFRDEGRGPIAWLINQKGTLSVGDVVICGEAYGRIRALYNDRDEELQSVDPSTPVKVAGLDIVPKAGDRFLAVDDIDLVRQIAEERRQHGRAMQLANTSSKRTLEDILNAARDGAVQDLFLIVKADTPGSLEALRHEILKFEHPEVRVKILHEGIGGVNESDVYLASASNAVIIAFHVIAEDRAEQLAQAEKVEIRRYNIIYEVIDEIRQTLEGMLRPEKKEVTTGRAIVLRVFSIGRANIAGCRILNGTIERSNRIHLIREQKILNNYAIGSLRREKDDAKEVREGMECGIRLEGFNDIKEGDLLEAFKIEEIRRTLE